MLLEYVKPDAEDRFRGGIAIPIYQAIQKSIEDLSPRHAPLRKALERAKHTGSRLARTAPTEYSSPSRTDHHDDSAPLEH